MLYEKCLQPQNYINHREKAVSELLGAKSQKNVTVNVNIFFNNTSKNLLFEWIKTIMKWLYHTILQFSTPYEQARR